MNTFLKNVKKAKRPSFGKSKKTRRDDDDDDDDNDGEGGGGRLSSPRSHDESESSTTPTPEQEAVTNRVDELQIPALRPAPVLRLGSFNFDAHHPRGALPFPNLFDEARDVLHVCNLVGTFVEVRKLARNGYLIVPMQSSRIMDVPVPVGTATKIIVQESERLREVLTNDGRQGGALSALDCVLRESSRGGGGGIENKKTTEKVENEEKNKDDNGILGWMGCGLSSTFSFDELTDAFTNTFCGGDLCAVGFDGGEQGSSKAGGGGGGGDNDTATALDSSMIVAVEDSGGDEGLAYVVILNQVEECVIVVFKGPRTKAYDVTDSVLVPDPRTVHGTTNTDEPPNSYVGVHRGFYESLFGQGGGGGGGGGGGSKSSNYMQIMKIVKRLLTETPSRKNYKLCITGHGSGGALATLFGLHVAAGGGSAASAVIPLPVTVVSIASPRVGDAAFARAFAEIESQGKLRHLRIANHGDPVPLGPIGFDQTSLVLPRSTNENGQSGEDVASYHTGMEMKLFKNVSGNRILSFDLTYSGSDVISGAKKTVTVNNDDRAADLACHYSTAYSDRLAYAESDLQGLTLNDVYGEKARVTLS